MLWFLQIFQNKAFKGRQWLTVPEFLNRFVLFWVLLRSLKVHVCSGNREEKVGGRKEPRHKSPPFVSWRARRRWCPALEPCDSNPI